MAPEIFNASNQHEKDSLNQNTSTPTNQPKMVAPSQRWKTRLGSDVKPTGVNRNPDDYSEVLAQATPKKSKLAAFLLKPIGIAFESQHSNEKILLFLRQHPVVNLPWIGIAILMMFAPFLFLSLIPFVRQIPWNYYVVMTLGWYLLTAGFIIERFLMWLFNSFIITDERIIDIDFYSLIYKQMDYAKIDKIQDISTRTGGVLYSLLDVGTIFVQTAGEVPEFVFENISHPARVVKLLHELIEEEEREELEGRVK